MLLKMLSPVEKLHFLDLADLLIMADRPLLWDGKTSDEVTSDTDLEKLSIEESEQDRELLAELESSAGVERERNGSFGALGGPFMPKWMADPIETSKGRLHVKIMDRLTSVLKSFPLMKMEKPETRIQAAVSVLVELLEDRSYERITTPKVLLFELLLVASRDGHITTTESALLKEYQRHYQLEDFIYDDLLERAELLNREVNKTISIIME